MGSKGMMRAAVGATYPIRTILGIGEWIMKPDTIPVYLHKVNYEKIKNVIIEVIVTIREGRSMPISENPSAEWLIRMNAFWKSKREEALSKGDV
jgi:hypothetical protein